MNKEYIIQLGGNDENRSEKTLRIFRSLPNGTKVILTGVRKIPENISPDHIDPEACDTLGNFILTRKWIEEGSTVYLVTDSHHILRSLGLARIVFGKKIQVVPCVEGVIGGSGHESFLYSLLDWSRAVLWKYTKLVLVRQPRIRLLRIS